MELKNLLGEAYKADMTADELVAALSSLDAPVGYISIEENAKIKAAMDRAASEAAGFKRQLKERMSAEELDKAERDTAAKLMQQELEDLRKEKQQSDHKAKYLALGFADDLAADTAAAMVNGDTEKVFENLKAHQASLQKAAQAQAADRLRLPPAGSGSRGDDYIKMAVAAQDVGNMAEAAYYTRLAQQDNNT